MNKYWLGWGLVLLLTTCVDIKEIPFIAFEAGFEAPLVVRQNEMVRFVPSASTDQAKRFLWRFGNERQDSSLLASPSYAYDSIGTYSVQLTVEIEKSNGLQVDAFTRNINVLPATETLGDSVESRFGQAEMDERGAVLTPTRANGFAWAGQRNINTLLVAKTDTNQIIQAGWPRTFSNFGTGQIFVRDMVETLDQSLILVGYFQYESADHEAFILKLDSEGNEVWRRILDSEKDERFVGIFEDENQQLIVVGTITSDRPAIVVYQYDATGNLISPYTLPQSLCRSCSAEAIRRTSDGGFAVAGTGIDRPLIVKFGPLYRYEARSILNLSGRGLALTQLQDGKYVLAGEQGANTQDSTNAFLAKFDFVGGVEAWLQSFVLYQERFYDIYQNENLDLILLGEHRNPLSSTDILLARFGSRNGLLREVHLLGNNRQQNAGRFYLSPEGNMTIIGTTEENQGFLGRQDISILRLKADFWSQ